jgi:hypothetical protein
MKKEKTICFDCKYFFITWDDRFPRGCRAMDFKSKKMPSKLVYEASGMPCTKFKLKKQSSR